MTIKRNTVIGIILILIDGFVFYYRSDIVMELLRGRALGELDVYELLLPVILLLVGLFLIFKRTKHDTTKDTT